MHDTGIVTRLARTLHSFGLFRTLHDLALRALNRLVYFRVLKAVAIHVYMYKGFTHEGYRGQRLHAAGMAQALQEYRAEGSKGIVSYVESNNFSSLKSCYRMGYVAFGYVVVLRVAGRYFIARSKGCRDRGVALTPLARAS